MYLFKTTMSTAQGVFFNLFELKQLNYFILSKEENCLIDLTFKPGAMAKGIFRGLGSLCTMYGRPSDASPSGTISTPCTSEAGVRPRKPTSGNRPVTTRRE